tara:strand:+ start:3652 stop:6138 length:2487 start_codon:yes stop_codon:yes gene_type:complete
VVISAAKTTEKEILLDVDEATKMLRLLQYKDDDPIILCCYGQTNLYHPPRPTNENYDWQTVTTLAAKKGRSGLFNSVQKDLLNPKTNNFGFISSPGGVAKISRKEITKSRLLVYEIDDEELTSQWGVWEDAGLPEPTVVMDSGNKSYHVWHALKEYADIEVIENLRKRISQTIWNYCGFNTDTSLHSCHQPTRLAGAIHPKGGRRSTVVYGTGNTYSIEEILKATDDIEEDENTTNFDKGKLWREDIEPIENNKYPKPNQIEIKLPVDLAISNKTKQLIKTGIQKGAKGNRHTKAFSIYQDLKAAEMQLKDLGYQVLEDDADNKFKEFLENSAMFDGDINKGFERHARKYGAGSFTCGQLSKGSVLRSVASYCSKLGIWKLEKDELKITHLINKSLAYKMDFFSKYVDRTVRQHRNSIRRLAYLRDVRVKLKLQHVIKEDQLIKMIMESQDVLAGNIYKSINAATRIAEGLPELNWLVENRIPKTDLTIIGGKPKVGKTRLSIGLARCLLMGEEFLDVKPAGLSKIILITDDQSDADSGQMMQAAGIYEHPNLYWSKKFRYTENDINRVLKDIKTFDEPIVILDSFRSTTRTTGVRENDQEAGMILYDLKHAITEEGGTFILLHHANKDNNNVGVDALSGNTAISGAANTVLTIHHLQDPETNKLQKNIKERRIVREARSGEDFDLIATLNFDNSFKVVCNFEDYQEKQTVEEQEKKVIDKLKKVPDDMQRILSVMLHRFNKSETAADVIELMKIAKLCKKSVLKKSDFINKELNIYTKINRYINEFIEANLVIEIGNKQKHLFGATTRSFCLSEKGAAFVDGLNLNF